MSKKVLFIGDVHGLSEWRELALDALKNFYEIVFLGDYVDSFHVRPIVQLENLKAIIAFVRKRSKDNVTLLLGNHDYAYLNQHYTTSGYQFTQAPEYYKLFHDNIDLFKVAWGYRDENDKYTLATHAGLTKTYWNCYILPLFEEGKFLHSLLGEDKPFEKIEIHEILNYLRDKDEILWKVGSMRGGVGTPGPLWADYLEFMEDPYEDINQVFGHTPKISVTMDKNGDDFYVCVDSWGNKKQASIVISL